MDAEAEKTTETTTDTRVDRRLIEEWMPIAALGEESVRERRSMTALPPTYYLHVWWARRPLVASRAAILASLLPADADRDRFRHVLGIHGDPVATRVEIDKARKTGANLGTNIYGYKRAFTYIPSEDEKEWIRECSGKYTDGLPSILDPTAGGGSIPFEGARLGLNVIGNDLNAVAWLVLKATVEFPRRYGMVVHHRFLELAERFIKTAESKLADLFPAEETRAIVDAYLWARTITCPYCGGLVPLSPNWRLNGKGKGVQLVPESGGGPGENDRRCTFKIVERVSEHSSGTVKGGDAECPFPDCARIIDGDEIKRQAQAGQMGQQLYCVVYNELVVTGRTKAGKEKIKKTRKFRASRPEDDVEDQVRAALDAKMPEWLARNIVPTEPFPEGTNDSRPLQYGMPLWRDMFAPRQLLGHCTSVEVFHDLFDQLRQEGGGEVSELDRAALAYLSFVVDKVVSYNSILSRWDVTREAIRGKFDRHDYAFLWSYGEMAPVVTGLGYTWAVEQIGKALKELIALAGNVEESADFRHRNPNDLVTQMASELAPTKYNIRDDGQDCNVTSITISQGSGDALALPDQTIDAVVMDPPYYDNVMYAELADFFYIWLKRTAGLIYPEQFYPELTDKDREAVANPAKFKGKPGGAKKLAGYDYQNRMAAIFRECRRVLKPNGIMTVMFTHKASGAWDALATGLVLGGFSITASWPVQTESEASMHIKDKNAAKSTIFLVCRPRDVDMETAEPRYWEEVEPQVMQRVRERVAEFQAAGISGVDLYLACFGPALQVFSENWPLTRGRPLPKPTWFDEDFFTKWDPYAARPEDALDAARREVKRWRMDQLTSVKRQHHLDALTEWYILAWDAFRAPKFPADEALKLARVVGLDFDTDVKNHVCEVKASDVLLWDSVTRQAKGKLGPPTETLMLDTLHQAAVAGRKNNIGAAKTLLEDVGLMDDPTLKTTLEALLNVLPPVGGTDFESLEKLRALLYNDEIPQSKQMEMFVAGSFSEDLDEVMDEQDG